MCRTLLFVCFVISALTNTVQAQFSGVHSLLPRDKQELKQTFLADMNGDGIDDLLLKLNDGNYTELIWSKGDEDVLSAVHHRVYLASQDVPFIRVADMNGDGLSDVVLTTADKKTIKCLFNTGAGQGWTELIVAITSVPVGAIELGDLNNDGWADIVLSYPTTGMVSVLMNSNGSSFLNEEVISSSENQPTFLHLADLDQDNRLDIISGQANEVRWFRNTNGSFGASQLLMPHSPGAHNMRTEDLDMDGDMDLIGVGPAGVGLCVSLNTTGIPFPSPTILPSQNATTAAAFYVTDLDSDGIKDIVFFAPVTAAYPYYKGVGSGAFVLEGPSQPTAWCHDLFLIDQDADGIKDLYYRAADGITRWLPFGSTGPEGRSIIDAGLSLGNTSEVNIGDIDGDGLNDIVLRNASNWSWYRNLGGGSFAPASVLSGLGTQIQYRGFGDMDGDGDMDVILWVSNQMVWRENDGTGSFGTSHPFPGTLSNVNGVADMNGDGALDVVLGNEGTCTVLMNDGVGNFSAYASYTLPNGSGYLSDYHALVLDMDGDGDMDIATFRHFFQPGDDAFSAETEIQFSWARNNGTPSMPLSITTLRVYSANDGEYSSPWPITHGLLDMDGDQIRDIVCYSAEDYMNITYQTFWSKVSATSGSGTITDRMLWTGLAQHDAQPLVFDIDRDGEDDWVTPREYMVKKGYGFLDKPVQFSASGVSLAHGDLTGDGFDEVVFLEDFSSGPDRLVYMELNPSSPLISKGKTVWPAIEVSIVGLADIDLDGDIDLITDRSWWEKQGTNFVEHPLQDVIGATNQIVGSGYMDQDNILDLIVHGSTGGYCVGQQSGFAEAAFAPITNGARRLVVDVDGDGDGDVVQTQGKSVQLNIQNANGQWSQSTLFEGSTNKAITAIAAADLDNDGDIDLVILQDLMANWKRSMYRLMNDGAGNFTVFPVTNQIKENSNTGSDNIVLADMDGDGYLDIVTRLYTPVAGLAWIPNDGQGYFSAANAVLVDGYVFGGTAPVIIAHDHDNDGDMDIVLYYLNDRQVRTYLNTGSGQSFIQAPSYLGYMSDFGVSMDVDEDGYPDIAFYGGKYPTLPDHNKMLWLRNGTGDVTLAVRVFLDGPFDENSGLMNTNLRAAGLIPLASPYLSAPNEEGPVGMADPYSGTGSMASVDHVLLELRNAADPTIIEYSGSFLLRADGYLTRQDGATTLSIPEPAGDYYVAIRHRNHLGCMTAAPISMSSTPVTLDLTDPSTATWGTDARRYANGAMLLWAGDVNSNGRLQYTGAGNDRDAILLGIGGLVSSYTTMGYYDADVNMDGTIRYTGSGNDRDPILVNIGGSTPSATRMEQIP